MTDKTKDHPKYTYLDILTSALTDHERKLNQIIERLDILVDKISKLSLESQESTRYIQQTTEEDNSCDENVESLLKMGRHLLPNEGD
jgi:uncharacterized coiled-coil protein SlyX